MCLAHDLLWMENLTELGWDDKLMISESWYDKLLKFLVYLTNWKICTSLYDISKIIYSQIIYSKVDSYSQIFATQFHAIYNNASQIGMGWEGNSQKLRG